MDPGACQVDNPVDFVHAEELAGDVINQFTRLQLTLSESRINFETNVSAAKETLNLLNLALKAKIEEANATAVKCLENCAQRRRNEFEKINREMNLKMMPKLFALKEQLAALDKAGHKSEGQMAELEAIKGKIEGLLKLEDHGNLEQIYIHFCPEVVNLLHYRQLHQIFPVRNAVKAWELALCLESCTKNSIEASVRGTANSESSKMSQFLFCEIFVLVFSMKNPGQPIFGPKDLRSMVEHGIRVTLQNNCIRFKLHFQDDDLLETETRLHVKVIHEDVNFSPAKIMSGQAGGGFKALDVNGTLPHRCQSTEGLDQSEINCLGPRGKQGGGDTSMLMNHSVSEEQKFKKLKSTNPKNVSFHETTTVFDSAGCGNGLTKQLDGSFAMDKEHLEKNANGKNDSSHWDLPGLEIIPMTDEEKMAQVFTNTTSWDHTYDTIDFAKEGTGLILFHKLSLHNAEALPQSIEVDPILNRIYVSDVNLGVIHMFESFKNKGHWPPGITFDIPRYVTCMPNSSELTANDVLVLDESGVRQLGSDGWNKEIPLVSKKAFASPCRGLSFWSSKNQIVTCEKTEDAIRLVFIERDGSIHTRVDISKDLLTKSEVASAKCVYVKATDEIIYTTDVQNGLIFKTETKTWTTRSLKWNNPGSIFMGIDVDPSGNLIVATCDGDEQKNCQLVIFSRSGLLERTLSLGNVRASGIRIFKHYLLLADVQSKSIHIFSIADK